MQPLNRRPVSGVLRTAVCTFLLLTGVALVPGPVRAAPLTVVSLAVTPTHIDDGQTSVFNVTVSGGAPPYTYNWSGLPPNLSWATWIPANVSRLSCTAGVPGTFWIGVIVTDSAGLTVAARPIALTVARPIGFDAEATPRQGTFPLTATFTNYGYGGTPPYNFSWMSGIEAKPTSRTRPTRTPSRGHTMRGAAWATPCNVPCARYSAPGSSRPWPSR